MNIPKLKPEDWLIQPTQSNTGAAEKKPAKLAFPTLSNNISDWLLSGIGGSEGGKGPALKSKPPLTRDKSIQNWLLQIKHFPHTHDEEDDFEIVEHVTISGRNHYWAPGELPFLLFQRMMYAHVTELKIFIFHSEWSIFFDSDRLMFLVRIFCEISVNSEKSEWPVGVTLYATWASEIHFLHTKVPYCTENINLHKIWLPAVINGHTRLHNTPRVYCSTEFNE